MTASNIFTCFATTAKLLKTTKVSFSFFKEILLPILIGFAVCSLTREVLFFVTNKIAFCASFCAVSLLLYAVLLLALGIVDVNDYT
jgi:predicted PurR-regulated permease PerM